jgi:hypothetical protein
MRALLHGNSAEECAGVSERDRAGKGYGQIPWRLALLEPVE